MPSGKEPLDESFDNDKGSLDRDTGIQGNSQSVYEANDRESLSVPRKIDRQVDALVASKLGPYKVYVLCPQVKGGLGVALIDTGSQVSLVREDALVKLKRDESHMEIQGITGNKLKVKGRVPLKFENTLEPISFNFFVVDNLPRQLDIILGQDWLSENGYMLSKPVTIPPHSETVVEFPTNKKGTRYVEHQILQPGVMCAPSLVNCEQTFPCLLVNTTSEMLIVSKIPKLVKPPANVSEMRNHNLFTAKRKQLLNEKLRLNHITEGAEEIRSICKEYVDIFKLPGDKLTSTTAAMHSIPTPSIPRGRAITLKNYRLAEAHQQDIKAQIDQMLADGIITPSKSEWNSPLLVIPKKVRCLRAKKFRISIDFRRLNELTIGDRYPLPNIQDILDKIGRARYFSALDCASGYLQVPIHPDDQCKTAFSTPDGHFEYKRMPFGLKSAPATFQRMMNAVLRKSIGNRCLVYINDILIMGETLSEHHTKLREVFEKLREYNIKIEPDKCEFLKAELNYLGHVVTAEGVKPDPSKVNAVSEFPTPQNLKDIKSFLGLAGYYRKFIEEFSAIARPLTDLLKKDNEWQWGKAEQVSFDLLK
ncbi:hypothetical protein ANN_27808 [Periplaneta americana]|uniref:Reverse transcriptase domain-containing protein n=1 Tax=Periplaneta americana TaxID=6978 RepID=A0ABQ8RVH3_PERAM|nr:hypothetical protein ANN_27808 [Periplaneta americana]